MPKQALHWSLWGFAGMATLGALTKSSVVQVLPALASDALGQALSLQVGFAFPAESGHEAVVFNDGSPAAGTLMLALASDFRSVFSAEVCKEAAKYHKRLSSLGGRDASGSSLSAIAVFSFQHSADWPRAAGAKARPSQHGFGELRGCLGRPRLAAT